MYNTLSNAYQLAILDYGTAGEWGITGRDAWPDDDEETYNATNAILIRDRLLKNVKTVKLCDNAKDQTACGFGKKYYLNGKEDGAMVNLYAAALLADSSSIAFVATGANATPNRGSGELSYVYGQIVYDINGIKPPNTYSKDIFGFYLTEHSIIPFGTTNETTYSFAKYCLGSDSTGLACPAWLVYIGNMDYLHCDELSWNGKHKCD